MKVKMENGFIYMIEVSPSQSAYLKTWREFKWSRKDQMWTVRVSADALQKLSTVITLPGSLARLKAQLDAVQAAVDAERIRPAEDLKPLVNYPVKQSLYAHQVRAANMALLTFGLVEPGEAVTI